MYKHELDKNIQNNSLPNSFVLFGESSFFIDTYIEKLASDKEEASLLTFYYDEYNYTSAKSHLSQASLFGDKNILIIKASKKVPKQELETLIDLCEKNPDNLFIYAYYGIDHKAYAKAFSKKSTFCVRFFHPKEFDAQNILLQQAKQLGIDIDKYSIAHLLQIHHGDIALASNELEKFKIFDKTITTKDIDSLVFNLSEVNIDDFIKKLLAKKDFIADIKNMLERGEDEIRLLTAITSYITQLYMFNIYIRVNGAPNAIAILGYPAPPQVVKEKADLSIKFKPNTYYKLHELLLSSELKMKSANVDKSAILLSTLIKIQKMV